MRADAREKKGVPRQPGGLWSYLCASACICGSVFLHLRLNRLEFEVHHLAADHELNRLEFEVHHLAADHEAQGVLPETPVARKAIHQKFESKPFPKRE